MKTELLSGIPVAFADQDGPALKQEADAMTLMGDMYATGADWIAIPVERLHPEMVDLRTRQFGLFLQKFMNYHVRVAILGDIEALAASSKPMADFIRESNRGKHVLFISDQDALAAKLSAG
ncbi:DUF4180 domain-containing protein [Henriciella aquimarina]|uniref:DUF4180 domain-containing protein n=1 Tax=Henriciella aquimarina TaxID=545261 RepID=UPI000A026DDF|nr:DUF4180 domain-containing protein [Henriciella aquimarina]